MIIPADGLAVMPGAGNVSADEGIPVDCTSTNQTPANRPDNTNRLTISTESTQRKVLTRDM
jgi:hypothetical protein